MCSGIQISKLYAEPLWYFMELFKKWSAYSNDCLFPWKGRYNTEVFNRRHAEEEINVVECVWVA
jgi:hypothetical protein